MSRIIHPALFALLAALCGGCISTPPEVIKLHAKEATLITELERSHAALIDAYVGEKLANFERFYFETYGPRFRANWARAFEKEHGRPYDEARDFPLLYNDLVAEYQERVEPIERLRRELRARVEAAYGDVALAHGVTGDWIESAAKLGGTQRRAADTVLGAASSPLTVEGIEEEFEALRRRLLAAE